MKLAVTRFKELDQVNHRWSIVADEGHTIKDVLEPEYLANIATYLRPYDEITAKTDDGSWYAVLLVLSCGRTWAKCRVLNHVQLTSKDVDITENAAEETHRIDWGGPHHKFRVIRKSDKEVLRNEFETRQDAQIWLNEYLVKV